MEVLSIESWTNLLPIFFNKGESNMEEHNPQVKKLILQVVSNQLKDNDPPETKQNLNRLMSEGYSRPAAKELIAAVVAAHIYDMLNQQRKFDNRKYIEDLEKLPTMPWDH